MKEEPKISNVVAGYRPAIDGEDHQFQTSAKPYLIQTAVSTVITILNVLSVDNYAYTAISINVVGSKLKA